MVFVFLLVVVQAGFLLVARHTASAAAAAAAREAARHEADLAIEQVELLRDVERTVPGAVEPHATITIEGDAASAVVTFGWRGPGPDLLPIRITVGATVPLGLPP